MEDQGHRASSRSSRPWAGSTPEFLSLHELIASELTRKILAGRARPEQRLRELGATGLPTLRGRVTRGVPVVALSLVALIAADGGAAYAFNWYHYERHARAVQFIVSTDKKECPDDRFPVYVLIGNASTRTLGNNKTST
jgi:hypothetical protein